MKQFVLAVWLGLFVLATLISLFAPTTMFICFVVLVILYLVWHPEQDDRTPEDRMRHDRPKDCSCLKNCNDDGWGDDLVDGTAMGLIDWDE